MEKNTANTDLSGIGGWLILVALEIIFQPLTCLTNLSKLSEMAMVIPNHMVQSMSAFILVSRLGYYVLLVYSLVLLATFFMKKKIFVPIMVSELVFRMLMISTLTYLSLGIKEISGQMMMVGIFGVTTSILWLMYYKKSIRVKNTFIH